MSEREPPFPEEDDDAEDGKSEAPEAPESPEPHVPTNPRRRYHTEPFEMMTANARLAVKLYGPRLPRPQISAELAGQFLRRLNALAETLGGPLGVTAFSLGSAVFEFAPESRDTENAYPGVIATDELSGDRIEELVEVLATDPDRIAEHARTLRPAQSYNLTQLVELLAHEGLHSEWFSRTRRVRIDAETARTATKRLQEERPVTVSDDVIVGRIYLVNARGRKFRLERELYRRVVLGRYPPELEERIRHAWNHRVSATVRATVVEVQRTGKKRTQYELLKLEELPELT